MDEIEHKSLTVKELKEKLNEFSDDFVISLEGCDCINNAQYVECDNETKNVLIGFYGGANGK